jgi:nucleotide sugar dehydrogenase
VPPGTCEHVVVPELESCLRERGLPADSLLLAHAYERVMPGDQYLASIIDYWRVYAGHTTAAAERCEAFLSKVVNVAKYPLVRLSSTTASEAAKLMENSYRATTIAFVEEWARFAEAVGVNLFEVVDAIRMRPTHNNMRQPGFGVGGYCLTKDPMFASVGARLLYGREDLTFPFSERAVSVNAKMPLVSLARLEALLGGGLNGKRVLLAGVAYRPDVGDTRYSPSEIFAKAAVARGATIVAHDPLVTHWPELDLEIASELPPSDSVDAVVFAVGHREYAALDMQRWLAGARPAVLDANHVLSPDQRAAVKRAGCVFAAIGEG